MRCSELGESIIRFDSLRRGRSVWMSERPLFVIGRSQNIPVASPHVLTATQNSLGVVFTTHNQHSEFRGLGSQSQWVRSDARGKVAQSSLNRRVLPPANSYTSFLNPRLIGAWPTSRPRMVNAFRVSRKSSVCPR